MIELLISGGHPPTEGNVTETGLAVGAAVLGNVTETGLAVGAAVLGNATETGLAVGAAVLAGGGAVGELDGLAVAYYVRYVRFESRCEKQE